ncbi:MAG: cation:dicarboxylase symporter family transporter, partial [Methyloceanibacter sp.]|uniref:dicarboxylate/amino acid:cation symporter n=1 Tax=Methyloceanibacter sp. TaxID=1965321 RepID=UPI003C566412
MARKLALHWQILIAIVLAATVGTIVRHYTTDGVTPAIMGVSFVSVFKFIGAIFLNALKMIIVPLITSSIIVGVAGIGSGGNIGALGWRTLVFYATTTLAAILIGLFVINAVSPGYVDGQPAGDILALDAPAEDISARIEGKGAGDVVDLIKRMVPPNIVKAAAEGQMLGLIFFSILFGYFMTRLQHDVAEPLFKFWNGIFHVMMKMTEFIMKFAPIGVFGLIAAVIAETGFAAA